jgi:hypothetical protein
MSEALAIALRAGEPYPWGRAVDRLSRPPAAAGRV